MDALLSLIAFTDIPAKLFKIEFEYDEEICPFPVIPAGLKPSEMLKAEESTSSLSVTKTAEPIIALEDQLMELQTVKFSDGLWANLMHYGDPSRSAPHAKFNYDTLDVANRGKPEATASATAVGVLAIHGSTVCLGWESAEAIVNSQQSSRDVAFDFVSRFTRFALMQRYLNNIQPPNGQVLQLKHQLYWRTNVLKDRRIPGITGKAGLADGILECGTKPNGESLNNAILMTKSYWSYSEEDLAEIFERDVVDDEGTFSWNGMNTSVQLLRQFWGSLVAMECTFGIWTNGKITFLAVKTDKNTLVLTQRKRWSDHETTKAIIGLTYAAIDHANNKWDDKEVDILANLIGETV